MGFMMDGFGWFDRLFPIIFTIIFVVILVVFVLAIGNGIKTWSRNNKSPILSVEATVVTKRMDVSETIHNHGDAMTGTHFSSSSTYYVTFQVQSGDRIELRVDSSDYGLMVEKDTGVLTFQGSRFIGFERR